MRGLEPPSSGALRIKDNGLLEVKTVPGFGSRINSVATLQQSPVNKDSFRPDSAQYCSQVPSSSHPCHAKNDPETIKFVPKTFENRWVRIFGRWIWILLVAGAFLTWKSLAHQQTPEGETTVALTENEPQRIHCQLIDTEDACSRKEKCRWLHKIDCCVQDYTATDHFQESTLTPDACFYKEATVRTNKINLNPSTSVVEPSAELNGNVTYYKEESTLQGVDTGAATDGHGKATNRDA